MIEAVKDGFITVRTDNVYAANLLMDIAEHMDCVIQKYYWRSRFDEEVIEEICPKIDDAFYCIVILGGDMNNLGGAYDVFKQKYLLYKQIYRLNIPLTQTEIEEYAVKMLQKL